MPTVDAAGAVLAHSLSASGVKFRKGRVLRAEDVAALRAAGIDEVTVARLMPGDLDEDAVAERIACALVPDPDELGLRVSAPFTGRVNFFAAAAGLFRVERSAVDALNRIAPAVTLATLADCARVEPRQMVATVKVIPYGVPGPVVASAVAAVGARTLLVAPFRAGRAALILTRTPGMKESLISKGAEIISARIRALGWEAAMPIVIAHETAAVAGAIRAAAGDLVLILGASATSDAADTGPAGLIAAGGRLIRFGMPVDPGNLLFLGTQAGRPVVGLPGCARSPALNGADWVLERIAAGIDVDGADIAAMGVGGLLKEIALRPQPRGGGGPSTHVRPRVAAIVLAAGAARRMAGRDKLVEPVGGQPLLRIVAQAALGSQADSVTVVVPPEATARREALVGLGVRIVVAVGAEGMATSLRAGLAAVDDAADAVVVLLADMPEVGPAQIDRLIAAFDPDEGREICRAVTEAGEPGHPVLFGRRFFETLRGLTGDRGAREVIREAAEFVVDVPTPGRAAIVDLDTPEEWAAWRASTAR